MRVHIFNPETDYALACKVGNYNPPASVVRLRKSMALFPATYAQAGDVILTLDDLTDFELSESKYFDVATQKCIKILRPQDKLQEVIDFSNTSADESPEIMPWGWNHSLHNHLLRRGIPSEFIKSEQEIVRIKSLAHRKNTIPFLEEISRQLPNIDVKIPKEFTDANDALAYAEDNPGCYFKMPWSSSGRGVICSSGMSAQKLKEWIRGAIAKQGSVMGEYGYDRRADFATEWMCRKGKTEFIGISWFDTSSNGKYLGNQNLSQEEIRQKIEATCNQFGEDLIAAQIATIDKLISPYYEGPMGIDMLADKQGNVNPCVEINLRMTMGMATILSQNEN